MIKEIIAGKKDQFEAAITHFGEEAAKIRSGRATPGLVENVVVDYYGTKTPLKQIASINVPEARLIVIQPWDKGSLVQIEAALRDSNQGFNPGNDGNVIRVSLPALTEERRKEFVKSLNQRAEEARISIRTIREDTWKEIQDLEKAGTIGEDDKFQGKDELQKVVDGYNAEIEAIREKKEKDILTV